MDNSLVEITKHASWVLGFFLLGYFCIIIEQVIKFNKAATALLMGVGCWTILFLEPADSVERHLYILTFQMFKVTQILFFLMGALTIVEIINVHKGFSIITRHMQTNSKRKLLWITGCVTFVLSSVLDNLTTTIVMVSLIAKLVEDREERLLLGGAIVIAANVGGAWTPIGDVATTLLWINGQITTLAVMRDLFLPSLFGLFAGLLWLSLKIKGRIKAPSKKVGKEEQEPGGTTVLLLGIFALIFVPIFKVLTDLPPYMGMMLGLGVMWVVTDLMHFRHQERAHLRVVSILPRIDIPMILFYLGILLAINSLQSSGLLNSMAQWLDRHIPVAAFPVLIGLISSIIDNVSLVAATIGMYDLQRFATDSTFWQTITYAAGTGGSILIIGSAAGVAFMALEKVDFMWYTKRITFPALITYFAGLFVYWLTSPFI